MSDNQNNQQKHECKCEGGKQLNALKKQVSDLKSEIAELRKELYIIRKAVHK
jgi:hypothetical protein